jgi:hypothetical protein
MFFYVQYFQAIDSDNQRHHAYPFETGFSSLRAIQKHPKETRCPNFFLNSQPLNGCYELN